MATETAIGKPGPALVAERVPKLRKGFLSVGFLTPSQSQEGADNRPQEAYVLDIPAEIDSRHRIDFDIVPARP